MYTFNPHKTGLASGLIFGGMHLWWALLVLFGWAQPLLNFIFTLHMLRPLFVVDGFSAIFAISLIFVTAIIGYLLGYLSAIVWNKISR